MILKFLKWIGNKICQWNANLSCKTEVHGMIEATIVKNDLKRLETSINRRLDAIESYTDDVIEKYLRKISARENRERKKEIEEGTEIPMGDPYSEILQKHGRV